MQLPLAVESVLRGAGAEFELVDATRAQGGATAVQATVLQDANGRVLALLGADCLLDLAALNRDAGRDLSALPEDALGALCTPRGLQSLPALPGVLDMPVIVDRRLLEAATLLLDSGEDDTRLAMTPAQFRRLLESSSGASASFGVPVSELEPVAKDAAADAEDFGNAVAKFTTRRIKQRLEDTLDFPPLPEIAHRIIQIGADPYASVKDLAQVVEIDPALSAQVVSWAASPYYAAPGKVRSIHDAIVRVLGFDLVMNLALGLALGKTMRLPREGRYGYRSYWLQAVHGAAMIEGLCKAMPSGKRPEAGHAYLSGLLHNFGFLVLAELFKPQLQLVCRYGETNPHLGHAAVERYLLGVTREQIGAWLMRFWHLPEPVCEALRFQLEPAAAGEHVALASVLNVAVLMLRQQGIGSAPDVQIPDSRFTELGISRADAQAVADRIRESGNDLEALARDLAA